MTKEQAINYMKSSGFSNETITKIIAALIQPCTDAISREAAVNACLNGWNKDYKEIVVDIRKLPPVKQTKICYKMCDRWKTEPKDESEVIL